MIIDLRTIPHGSRSFEFCFEKDWWRSDDQDDQILALDTLLQVKIKIERVADEFVFDGELAGGVQVRCDRCLEPYHQDLKFEFRVFLALPPPVTNQTEVELLDDDMEVDFIKGEEIEIDEIIREQIYLSLSMKSLCSKDCLGLCSVCGINLNRKKCECRSEQGHPGFSKLRNLKTKGE